MPHLQGAQVGAAGIEDVQLRLHALQRTPVVIIAEDGDRPSAKEQADVALEPHIDVAVFVWR